MARDITSIMLHKETKKRFSKQFQQAKKKTTARHFYIDDYINLLLDKDKS